MTNSQAKEHNHTSETSSKNKDEIFAKARKLLALAKGGIGGEKEAAQKKLDEHILKHGLKIEDIDESYNTRTFEGIFDEDEVAVMMTIIFSVNQTARPQKQGLKVICELDKEDYAEVQHKFAYFVHLWRIEKDMLTLAFYSKHRVPFEPDEYARNKHNKSNAKVNDAVAKAADAAHKLNSIKHSDDSKLSPLEKIQKLNRQRLENGFLNNMLESKYIRKRYF